MTEPGRILVNSRFPWALALLVLLAAIALPTGFDAGFLPWFFVEMAGAITLLWLWRQGEYKFASRAWRVAGPLTAWLSLSVLVATIQVFSGATESRFETFRQLHFFAGGLLLIPLVARVFPDLNHTASQKWTAPVVSTLLVASLLTGSWALQQPSPTEGTVVFWPFVYRNHYAAFVLLVLPVLCWLALVQSKSRWSAAVGVSAGIAGIVSSGSRSGVVLLGLTLGSLAVLASLRSNKKHRKFVLAATMAVVAIGVGLANLNVISWRLQNTGSLLEGRLDYWRATLHMISERPWLGWGFGTWPEVYLQFLVRDTGLVVNHAHSDWLEFFSEAGVVPVLALGVLFARSLWLTPRHPWLLGVPAVLLLAMVDYPLRLPLLLLIIVALYVTAEIAQQLPTHSPLS